MNVRPPDGEAGFTLAESLAALLVLSLIVGGLMQVMSATVRKLQVVERKNTAFELGIAAAYLPNLQETAAQTDRIARSSEFTTIQYRNGKPIRFKRSRLTVMDADGNSLADLMWVFPDSEVGE